MGARDALIQAVLDRELEAAMQVLAPAGDLAGHEIRRADPVQRERLHIAVADLMSQLQRLLAPANSLVVVPAQHAKPRAVRIGHGPFPARRELVEDLDGLLIRLLGEVVEPERDCGCR